MLFEMIFKEILFEMTGTDPKAKYYNYIYAHYTIALYITSSTQRAARVGTAGRDYMRGRGGLSNLGTGASFMRPNSVVINACNWTSPGTDAGYNPWPLSAPGISRFHFTSVAGLEDPAICNCSRPNFFRVLFAIVNSWPEVN